MKIRLPLLVFLALSSTASFAQTTPPPAIVAGRPVLWSVHFDAERLRTGAGKELFASLDPMLTAVSGGKSSTPGGKLESLAVFGFQPQKGPGEHFPFLADFSFSADGGGISRHFDEISKKHDAPIETVAGYPTIHFQHQGKEVWIAKLTDSRVILSTSRPLLEQGVASGAGGPGAALPSKPNEILGGNVDIESLLEANPALRASELLSMLPHLDFHVISDGGPLDVNASAELDSDRSARRAARMIDGMVAAVSLHDRVSGIPWDDRLALKQDGARLAMQLHLEPQEAKKLLDTVAHEIANHAKAATHAE